VSKTGGKTRGVAGAEGKWKTAMLKGEGKEGGADVRTSFKKRTNRRGKKKARLQCAVTLREKSPQLLKEVKTT